MQRLLLRNNVRLVNQCLQPKQYRWLSTMNSTAGTLPDYQYSVFQPLTVPEGERVSVVNGSGKQTTYDGPKRLMLWNSQHRFLTKFTANDESYLVVENKDGTIEYKHGPIEMFEDPIKTENIYGKDGVDIDVGDTMLVQKEDGDLIRIDGPTVYRKGSHVERTWYLKNYMAGKKEFIVARRPDGSKEIFRGPCELKSDPFKYTSISVCDAWVLDENDYLLATTNEDQSRIISGPVIYAPENPDERIRLLESKTASDQEYLVVKYWDGRTEIVKGPCNIVNNPIEIESIEKKEAYHLTDHEVMVVYKNSKREIIRGPTFYIPDSDEEKVHQFSWHGSKEPGSKEKVPFALNFTKMLVVPRQLYYNIDSVRTKDDALITAKVMIFYENESVEKMLEKTNDPIANFINAVTADIVSFASNKTFNDFKEHVNQLNELDQFPNLVEGAESIGFKISKIVFRGYIASSSLQHMHDDSINERTKLVLEAETAKQEQELENARLEAKLQREEKLRENRRKEVEADIELENKKHEANLKRELELRQLKSDMDNQDYTVLAQNGVDVNRYLIAPLEKADKVISIEGQTPVFNEIQS